MEMALLAGSEFKTWGSIERRSRKPLWVTGPSRVQISPSPPHFLRGDPPRNLNSEDRPQGRFSSFSGTCMAGAQKGAMEGQSCGKNPKTVFHFANRYASFWD